MKRTLLSLTLSLLFCYALSAQVTAGHIDDFEDGTEQNWDVGAASPINIADGGPMGAGDNYLQYTSTGNPGGPGSKVIVINRTQWSGDYTSEGILAIKFDVRVEGGTDLSLRVAFADIIGQLPMGVTQICTTNPVVVTSGSGWTSVTIPISASDFTVVTGTGSAASVLANAAEARILHNSFPSWVGEATNPNMAVLELDNIEASTTLSTPVFEDISDFSVYPNPSKRDLNIVLQQIDQDSKVEVFDVLGKRIYASDLSQVNTRINAAEWNSGVYLVRVTNGNATQTKRFVKQ